MRLVRFIKDWTYPDILRQSPGGRGIWNDVQFTIDDVEECDYAIVLSYGQATVRCPPSNLWLLMQEPPAALHRPFHRGSRQFAQVLMQNPRLAGARRVCCQPALPWAVNRDYDFLKSSPPPDKTRHLSWITSNLRRLRGHRRRMTFLESLRASVDFDLFGRGFTPIDDKWDGLAPYRYSLAVENFRGPYYWTEKIIDPLLAWTMPIYYGCTNLDRYLPRGSFVAIDIDDPGAPRKVRETIGSDLCDRNRDAIAEARRLILDRYQLLPFLVEQIQAWESRSGAASAQPRAAAKVSRRHPAVWRALVRAMRALGLDR